MASKMERVWLQEYLSCWNATEAARRAGYKWPNKVGPSKLAKFEDEIQERLDELVMSADEALARLSEIARGEYAQYISADGDLDVARMVEDDKAHLIAEIRETSHGKSYKLHDMHAALRDIAKAQGVFVDKVDVTTGGESLNLGDTERNRAMATLAAALSARLSGADRDRESAVGAAEQAAMAGGAE